MHWVRCGIAACVAVLLITGCADSPQIAVPAAREASPTPASGEVSIGIDVPADDPSAARADTAGQTPDDVVRALVEARYRLGCLANEVARGLAWLYRGIRQR